MLTFSVPVRTAPFCDWPQSLPTRTHRHVLMLIDGSRQVWDIARILQRPVAHIQSILSYLIECRLAAEQEVLPAQATCQPAPTKPLPSIASDTAILRTFHATFPGFQVSRRWHLPWFKNFRLNRGLKQLVAWRESNQEERVRRVHG